MGQSQVGHKRMVTVEAVVVGEAHNCHQFQEGKGDYLYLIKGDSVPGSGTETTGLDKGYKTWRSTVS